MDLNTCTDWQPIGFTLVEYPKGDLYGKVLAIISLIPVFSIAGFIALIMFRRDLHTISFFCGVLLNEVINRILKYWIKEPRPIIRYHVFKDNGYGMPSSHSQFIWFFTIYTTLFILIRLHHMNNNAPLEKAVRIIVLITCWALACLVCISRIYLVYHTWQQVFVGSVIGTLLGGLWFCFTHFTLTPLYPCIVTWKISEFFLLRDTTLIPNILWFEYTVTRQESRARARKLISRKSQ